MEIHVSRGQDRSGPYTLEKVREYMAEGVMLPDDLAWHEGLEGARELRKDDNGSAKRAPPQHEPHGTPDDCPILASLERPRGGLSLVGGGVSLFLRNSFLQFEISEKHFVEDGGIWLAAVFPT